MISFSEELVFRGYVLRNLMKSFNKWMALVISALLFSIVHFSNEGVVVIGIINTVLGGLVLGLMFMLTRTLWLPVFFHLSWNFVQGPVLGFKVSGLSFQGILLPELHGATLVTGGDYGFEGSILCTGLLLSAFIAGCYLESNKTN
jgi:membrane protease YdiL (CAAX protease family)